MKATDTQQETPGQPDVRPGQVWADNDPRSEGRTVRVDRLSFDGKFAACTVLTNSDSVQAMLDSGTARSHGIGDRRGRSTRLSVQRMRPTRTGYRLVQDSSVDIDAPDPRYQPGVDW